MTDFETHPVGTGAALIAAEARADLPPTLAEALVEALTPSGDTKAAYMGEIKDPETKRMVSWTAIKMVMKIVSDRAALRAVESA